MPRKQTKSFKKHKLLAQLKRSLDGEAFLRDVIGARNIEEDGDELRHSCVYPFGLHSNGDENPSASFNIEKMVVHCFTCGTGGDIFWFIQTVKDCSQEVAIGILREQLVSEDISSSQLIEELEAAWTNKEDISFDIPTYSERILKPWICYSPYLDERNITRKVQKRMKTGVDINHKDKVKVKTKPGEPKKEVIIEQPRLVIPHFWKGSLVGWSKRKLEDEQKGPKYKHSPNFPKSMTLYGLDIAKKYDSVIVTESPTSVLRLLSEGIGNSIGTFGAALPPEQLEHLRMFDDVILAIDGDDSGRHFAEVAYDNLNKFCNVWVVPCEAKKDIGDYGRAEIDKMLKDKEPALLWA